MLLPAPASLNLIPEPEVELRVMSPLKISGFVLPVLNSPEPELVSVVTPLNVLPPVPASFVAPVFSILVTDWKIHPFKYTSGAVNETVPSNSESGPILNSELPVRVRLLAITPT